MHNAENFYFTYSLQDNSRLTLNTQTFELITAKEPLGLGGMFFVSSRQCEKLDIDVEKVKLKISQG